MHYFFWAFGKKLDVSGGSLKPGVVAKRKQTDINLHDQILSTRHGRGTKSHGAESPWELDVEDIAVVEAAQYPKAALQSAKLHVQKRGQEMAVASEDVEIHGGWIYLHDVPRQVPIRRYLICS